MRPLLILDAYVEAPGAVGFFTPWLDIATHRIHLPTEPCPADPAAWSGILITGSASSLTTPEPWVESAADLVRGAVSQDVPVLGVCFGHQLLGWACIGPHAVRKAPRPEVGFLEVEQYGHDPLLASLPARFTPFVSHEDEVVPQPGMHILARSAACTVQAFRLPGRPAWGVQFHVEYPPDEELRILRYRAERHPELGLDPDAIAPADTDPLAAALFARFVGVVSGGIAL